MVGLSEGFGHEHCFRSRTKAGLCTLARYDFRGPTSTGLSRDLRVTDIAFTPGLKIARGESDMSRVNWPFRVREDDDRLDCLGLYTSPLPRVACRRPGEFNNELTPVEINLPDFPPQVAGPLGTPHLQEHAPNFRTCNEFVPGNQSDHTTSAFPRRSKKKTSFHYGKGNMHVQLLMSIA